MNQISVIIPTLLKNSLDDLKAAISSQTIQAKEVIIVSDPERRGSSWTRNQGIYQSTGKYIAFIDDDCIPDNFWLESLMNGIIKFDGDIAGGTYKETDPLLKDLRQKRKLPTKLGPDLDGGVGAGGNIMYSRAILNKIKLDNGQYFDESFRFSQDYELLWRAKMQGAKIIFVPNYPTHLKRVNFSSYLRLQFNRGRGIGLLYQKMQNPGSDFKAGHKSLIWKEDGKIHPIQWFKVMAIKLIGPFDIKKFSKFKHFIYYWIGEKFKSCGFAYQIITKRKN